MNEMTRIVRLGRWASRERATNEGTRLAPRRLTPPFLELLFAKTQREMHRIVAEETRPGLFVFALAEGRGVAGRLWLAATNELRAGTIGRHSAADLYLPDDEGLSLRHLAVLVRQKTHLDVRVMDLRTGVGLRDERGEPVSAARLDGPAFLSAASYWLFFVPSGEAAPWDVDAANPWATLPARVLLSRSSDEHPYRGAGLPARPASASDDRVTRITLIRAPVDASSERLLGLGEPAAGHLVLDGAGGEYRMKVGGDALERGILLGRYARCDGSAVLQDASISRVHALVVREGGALYLVDVGSSNGVWRGTQQVRVVELEPGSEGAIALAHAARIRWEPAH